MPKKAKKGILVVKNATGRQLVRVSAIKYRETLWSELYPGNRHTVDCLQPAVLGTENALELVPERRKRTVWRIDGGAGSDTHLIWLLGRGYHVVAKGCLIGEQKRSPDKFVAGMPIKVSG